MKSSVRNRMSNSAIKSNESKSKTIGVVSESASALHCTTERDSNVAVLLQTRSLITKREREGGKRRGRVAIKCIAK